MFARIGPHERRRRPGGPGSSSASRQCGWGKVRDDRPAGGAGQLGEALEPALVQLESRPSRFGRARPGAASSPAERRASSSRAEVEDSSVGRRRDRAAASTSRTPGPAPSRSREASATATAAAVATPSPADRQLGGDQEAGRTHAESSTSSASRQTTGAAPAGAALPRPIRRRRSGSRPGRGPIRAARRRSPPRPAHRRRRQELPPRPPRRPAWPRSRPPGAGARSGRRAAARGCPRAAQPRPGPPQCGGAVQPCPPSTSRAERARPGSNRRPGSATERAARPRADRPRPRIPRAATWGTALRAAARASPPTCCARAPARAAFALVHRPQPTTRAGSRAQPAAPGPAARLPARLTPGRALARGWAHAERAPCHVTRGRAELCRNQ